MHTASPHAAAEDQADKHVLSQTMYCSMWDKMSPLCGTAAAWTWPRHPRLIQAAGTPALQAQECSSMTLPDAAHLQHGRSAELRHCCQPQACTTALRWEEAQVLIGMCIFLNMCRKTCQAIAAASKMGPVLCRHHYCKHMSLHVQAMACVRARQTRCTILKATELLQKRQECHSKLSHEQAHSCAYRQNLGWE